MTTGTTSRIAVRQLSARLLLRSTKTSNSGWDGENSTPPTRKKDWENIPLTAKEVTCGRTY